MAQEAYATTLGATVGSSGAFSILNRTKVLRLGIVYESVPEDITGVSGGNRPWVSMYIQIQAEGSSDTASSTDGKLRTEVRYSNNSLADLTESDGPFANYSTISNATSQWLRIMADGTLKTVLSGQTASSTPLATGDQAESATPANRQKIPLSTTLTPTAIRYHWTSN